MFKRESEKIEFKRSTKEVSDAMKSVSGMLNKYGEGTIYFGIKNDGTIVKNTISDSTLRDVSRAIYESIDPVITPTIEIVIIDNVEVIKLSFYGNDQPYSSKGVYYKRVADENRPMSQNELMIMFQSKHYEDSWEKKITQYSYDDIDDKTLKDFYLNSIKVNRLEMKEYDKKDLLNMLSLASNNKLNNAGYYLFGKNVNTELKMVIYATKSKTTIIDMACIKGNIYTLVNEGINYISKNINWKVEIKGSKREDIPEIPLEAIREIVVNSFAHAKYSDENFNEINIFPETIEIYNQGSFPLDYTPLDFIDEHISSLRRNPIILDVLFRSKDVEKSGSGFSRMNEYCEKFNIKWSYEKLNNGFKFVFLRKNSDRVIYNSDLNDEELLVLNQININNQIKISDLAINLNLSTRTIQRIIKNLTNKGYIKRVGTKSGYWNIISK